MKYINAVLLYCVLFALYLGNPSNSQAQTFTLDSTTLVADTVLTGLNVPWELKWGPDNFLWMTEREGKVSRVDPQTGARTIILDVSQANAGPVYQIGEAGMLGFTFHPNFPDSSFIYIAYTYRLSGNVRERLVRYEYDADSLINSFTLIEGILGNSTHNGSRVVIGPDNKVYMTTGDAQTQPNAQNVTSVNGKTLRLNLDGSIPSDNPIPGSPIWSWGHRNPQGLVFAPSGALYSSEHGPNSDDEINVIRPARNYGWPSVNGICNLTQEITFCSDSNVVESIYQWTPTIAPSDLIYYDSPAIPEWQGTLLLSVLKNKRLIRLTLNSAGDSITSETSYFINQWGRLRDICAAPDGSIYLATNGASAANTDPNTHSIIRLRNLSYLGILNIDAGKDTAVCTGSDIQLQPTINGGALPLNYNWSPSANLSCSSCVNPIASSITDTTVYVLMVTDNNGDTAIDSLTVNVLSSPGPISYTYTILDTFGNPAMVEININIPAADSVLVISSYYDTIGVFLNTQNITFIDSSGGVSCTIGDGDCWIDFDLWVYAYSACGFDSLYDYQQIIVDESSSIKHVYNTLFQVYPNPTDGKMTIAGLKPGDQISILNITGKKMIQFAASNNSENTTDLSNLPSGVYFISVERDGLIGVQKLIKY